MTAEIDENPEIPPSGGADERPAGAGSAAEVLARLGLSAEDLRAGRVPEHAKEGYTLDPEGGTTPVARRGWRPRRPAPEPPEAGSAAADAEPDPEGLARTIALRKLAAAPQSRAMLAEAMAKKDVPAAAAERVLDRLTEVGLVDDAEYAAMLVRTRHEERHQARFAIAQELRRRGIDKDIAADALDQVDDADERLAALEFARKKMRSMRGLERDVRKRRLIGALSRRGFGAGTVYGVIAEVLDADPDAPTDLDGEW